MFSRIKHLFVLIFQIVSLLCSFLVCLTNADVEVEDNYADHWCYAAEDTSNCGPKSWHGPCHTGKYQSPIDIRQKDVVGSEDIFVPVEFSKSYFKPQPEFYVENNGHSITAYFDKGKYSPHLHISPGPAFVGAFVFSQIHLHWGQTKGTGSEHKVNGTGYVIEIHMVHLRDRKLENATLNSMQNASERANWLGFQEHRAGFDPTIAVISVFASVSDLYDNFTALDPILKAAQDANETNSSEVIEKQPLNPSAFFPEVKTVYQYEGSLTTPPCTETVWWTLFKYPLRISKTQLEILLGINSFEHKHLTGNYRPSQSLNGRKILERQFDFGLVENLKETLRFF